MSARPALRIGPIEARVEADAVCRYREATAFDDQSPDQDTVPATFPAVWLWHPTAQAALRVLLDEYPIGGYGVCRGVIDKVAS